MPKKRLPNHQDLLLLFESHTLAQLAEMFQVKENTVAQKIAEARRLRINPNPALEARRQQIQKMLQEGKSFSQMDRILNIRPSSVRSFAIHHGLYTPNTGLYAVGNPIGCPKCMSHPYARGLCRTCYLRFRHLKTKKFIDYPDQLLILDHPKFKVFYHSKIGYIIHCQFFDTTHLSRPNTLEQILLDQLQRQIHINLHNTVLELEYHLITQEDHDNKLPPSLNPD
jgi:hypothetical protein